MYPLAQDDRQYIRILIQINFVGRAIPDVAPIMVWNIKFFAHEDLELEPLPFVSRPLHNLLECHSLGGSPLSGQIDDQPTVEDDACGMRISDGRDLPRRPLPIPPRLQLIRVISMLIPVNMDEEGQNRRRTILRNTDGDSEGLGDEERAAVSPRDFGVDGRQVPMDRITSRVSEYIFGPFLYIAAERLNGLHLGGALVKYKIDGNRG